MNQELPPECTGPECPLYPDCQPEIKGWVENWKVGDADCEK